VKTSVLSLVAITPSHRTLWNGHGIIVRPSPLATLNTPHSDSRSHACFFSLGNRRNLVGQETGHERKSESQAGRAGRRSSSDCDKAWRRGRGTVEISDGPPAQHTGRPAPAVGRRKQLPGSGGAPCDSRMSSRRSLARESTCGSRGLSGAFLSKPMRFPAQNKQPRPSRSAGGGAQRTRPTSSTLRLLSRR